MREIKFEFMTQDRDRNIEKAVLTIDELMDGDFPYFEIDDLIAKRQFTGLLDKNGVEIYEGDIVRWGMDGQECWIRYAVVELFPCLQFKIIYYVEEKTNAKKPTDNHIFGYSNFIYKQTDKYLKVIGNIYENPELLD